MPVYTLRTQMIAPVAVRDAFSAFEETANLALITPPWLGFSPLDPRLGPRVEVQYGFKVLGLPIRLRGRIEEWEPPFWLVERVLFRSRLLWSRKRSFHPGEEGALITDELEYSLPLGPIGDLVQRAAVAEHAKRAVRYQQEKLNDLLCSGRARWTDPVFTGREPVTEKPPRIPPSGTASPETRKRAAL